MENIGIIDCKYHPQKLNYGWCSQCGNPICEECTVKMPKAYVRIYPDICPRCKQKNMNLIMKLSLILGISVIVIIFVIQLFISSLQTFIISVVGVFGLLFYFIAIYLKERGKYNRWMATIEERTISDEEIQNLIKNNQLEPCKYHDMRPSINKCDECGINTCINCSTIFLFPGIYFLCIECFWQKKKRVLKIFMWLFGVPFILLLAMFVPLTIAFWGSNPLSFYIVVPSFCLYAGIILICLYVFYTKTQKKYEKWKNEITGNFNEHSD